MRYVFAEIFGSRQPYTQTKSWKFTFLSGKATKSHGCTEQWKQPFNLKL